MNAVTEGSNVILSSMEHTRNTVSELDKATGKVFQEIVNSVETSRGNSARQQFELIFPKELNSYQLFFDSINHANFL